MQILAQLIVSGISVGMIYGVIAFGYQLTFATSKTLNFGQGEALMLGALVGLTTINFLIGQALGTLCGLSADAAGRVRLRRCCRAPSSSGSACARRSGPSRRPAGSWRRSRSASSSGTSPKTSGAATR